MGHCLPITKEDTRVDVHLNRNYKTQADRFHCIITSKQTPNVHTHKTDMTNCSGGTLAAIIAALLALSWCLGCAAQFGTFPATIFTPCSSAPTRALSDLCLLNLTFTHLYLEEAGDWDGVMDTLANDSYEFYSHTMMGGIKAAPYDSDQSLYYMYSRINFVDPPESLQYYYIAESIGANTIVFEAVVEFNHTSSFWLLPLEPTNELVSVYMVLSIGFDDDNKMLYERAYIDGGSILTQIGILQDGYSTYKDNIPLPPKHAACHFPLPVLGDELATLMLDGAVDSGIVFNQFYATAEPSPSPSPHRRSHANSAPVKRDKAYGSMIDWVHASMGRAADTVDREARYHATKA